MMNVVAPPNPSAWPPIQIRTKKKIAQRSEMTPWSNAGGRRCITRRILLKRRPRAGLPAFWTKKFTEPVALSSTFPVNLRLPPTALGSGFDLLALRARCKRELRGPVGWEQGWQIGNSRNLRKYLYARPDSRILLHALQRKRTGPEIRR